MRKPLFLNGRRWLTSRRLHKLILDYLGVSSVAVVIGGSMGGMAILEWPLCSPPGYVRHIIPIATSARHSAWCISWGEAQRQSIYSDPLYDDGYHTVQPVSGLAAAPMAALLTYRSRDSYEKRFGRTTYVVKGDTDKMSPPTPFTPPTADEALFAHNNGHLTVEVYHVLHHYSLNLPKSSLATFRRHPHPR